MRVYALADETGLLMASWGGVLAWTGFYYDAVEAVLSVKRAEERVHWFWSNGSAWRSS
jgi:hypothetical protein